MTYDDGHKLKHPLNRLVNLGALSKSAVAASDDSRKQNIFDSARSSLEIQIKCLSEAKLPKPVIIQKASRGCGHVARGNLGMWLFVQQPPQ